MNISNLAAPTKRIKQNWKSIQLPAKWIFTEHRATDSFADIIFLKTFWFADIKIIMRKDSFIDTFVGIHGYILFSTKLLFINI